MPPVGVLIFCKYLHAGNLLAWGVVGAVLAMHDPQQWSSPTTSHGKQKSAKGN